MSEIEEIVELKAEIARLLMVIRHKDALLAAYKGSAAKYWHTATDHLEYEEDDRR